ncbi:autotransporter outer membrane beta-barrel domain-containing protein [Microvirga alba]|uniref:Autotransporter domain-containing protein n=1 Tax=Microvirga alba TaxID=2791025 RepID=A0A931BRI1_9HYPH|nr:autotransporter domain-containing protein [Microvirga alba]MBF9233313.1 autotransporter domain-containing protein [Microvirga alba]
MNRPLHWQRQALLQSTAIVLAVVAVGAAERVQAQTYTFQGTGGAWSNFVNWQAGALPMSSPTANLVFDTGGSVFSTDNDLGALLINRLSVAPPMGGAWTFGALAGGSLSFSGIDAAIDIAPTAPFSLTINQDLSLNSQLTVRGGNAGDQFALNGVVSGGGALIRDGRGTLSLSGSNSFTGGTQLYNNATISVGHNNALGSGVLTSYGGTLEIRNGITISNEADLEGNLAFTVGTGAVGTYAGLIRSRNDPWGIIKTGAGTLVLSNANTFDMGAIISEGALRVTHGNALGLGQITLNGGTLQAGASVTLANLSMGINTAGGKIDTNGYALSFAGTIYDNDGPGGILTKTGAGTLTLSGTSTYTGATNVNAGTLQPGGMNRLSPNSTFTIASGAILDLNGFNQRIGSLAGAGNVALGAETLTVGRNNADTEFSGVIGGIDGSVVKEGSGTFTLSGVNTYTGATRVRGGTLAVSSDANLGDSSGDLRLDGGTFRAKETFASSRLVAIGANAPSVSVDSGRTLTFDGVASGSALTKIGPGTLTLAAANTYTGGTSVNGGVVSVSSDANLGAPSGGVRLDGGALRATRGFTTARMVTLGAGNGGVTVDAGQDFSLAGLVTGNGGLEKAGAGLLRLTRANDYRGGTQVSEGTLLVKTDGALGSGPVVVDGADSTLTFSDSASAGALSLKTMDGGHLRFNDRASAGSATITNDHGALVFAGNASAGTARVTSTNGSTILFEGAGKAAQARFDNAGSSLAARTGVTFSDTSTAEAASFTNGAFGYVTFTDNSSAGTSSIVNNDKGTAYFSGRSTADLVTIVNNAGGNVDISGHTGPMAIGSLTGAGNVFLGGNKLTLGSNGADGIVQGGFHDGGASGGVGGSLVKAGAGRLTLTGTSTYTGGTLVQAGTLQVDGSLTSSVTVADAATLSGAGEIGGLLARNGSFVAPGNLTKSLDVDGNASFEAGSTYRVRIMPGVGNDRISVSGAAQLQGGTVSVTTLPGGTYVPGARYTLLSAADGVSGTFASLAHDFAFLSPVLEYDAKKVDLTLPRKSGPPGPSGPSGPVPFPSVATSSNQTSVAGAVETLGANNPLFRAVIGQSVSGARQAFNGLSGEAYASAAASAYANGGLVTETLMARLRGVSRGPAFVPGSSVYAAYAMDRPRGQPDPVAVPYPDLDPRAFTLWGEGFGSWGKTRANGNAAALDSATGGFMIGAEFAPRRAYRVGVAGGFTRTTFDVEARLSSGSNESVFGSLYGSAAWGGIQLRLGAGYAATDIDTKRRVVFPGFFDQLSASYRGSTLQAFSELGYRIDGGRTQIEPFIGLAAMRLHTEGFTENGGPAALTGYGQDQDLGTTTLGVRAEARLSEEIPVNLRGLVAWRYAYGDVSPNALLAFGGGASAFTVTGTPVDRNALVAEAGLDWQVTRAVTLGAAYQGQIGNRAQEHALKGNFIWRF